MNGLGEFFAIGCALTWSIAVILFRDTTLKVHPLVLNLLKNLIGLSLLIPTALLVEGQLLYPVTSEDFLTIALSGFLGIAIADSLAFFSLRLIGATRFAIVETTYTPFVVGLSFLLLGENLTSHHWIGVILIVAAMGLIISEGQSSESKDFKSGKFGIYLGLIGLIIMAYGIILMKPVFERHTLFYVTNMRLIVGTIGCIPAILLVPKARKEILEIHKMKNFKPIFWASFFSTYLSMMMWMGGFKYAPVSVAAILNQTTTIFTVILASLVLKEKLTLVKLVGAILAFAGVITMIYN